MERVTDESQSKRTLKTIEWLETHDPLSDVQHLSFNDAQTFHEFIGVFPDVWWCPDTGVIINSTGLNNYYESFGTSELYKMLVDFNEGRLIYALARLEEMHKDNDKQSIKMLTKYRDYVTRANTSGALGQFVKLFCLLREISSSKLNKWGSVFGCHLGCYDADNEMLVIESDDDEDNERAKAWFVTKNINAKPNGIFHVDQPILTRWYDFVDEIMCHDAEMIEFLQRALGYSIVGGNAEEVMFIAYGASTRNGKGTLLNSIVHVMGDYAASMPPSFLVSTRDNGGTDDALASLVGKRFVVTNEPKDGGRLDESKVKTITGNDIITTSRKYGHTFSFQPEFTIWLSCNTLPLVSDTSVFSSNRLIVVPFERHFDDSEQDLSLKELFRSDSGMTTIFDWLVTGYVKYKKLGLAIPKKVRDATSAYRAVGGSSLRRFLGECCEITASERVEIATMKDAYHKFCEVHCEIPLTAQAMRRELELMGVSKVMSNGVRYWQGIRIIAPAFLLSNC